MNFQPLHVSSRPKKFNEVLGQEVPCKILKNSLKRDRISSSYLFSGPRGSGKTSLARIFGKSLSCSFFDYESLEPCNNCSSCLSIDSGTSIDLIEIDGASYGSVDNIRELIPQANLRSLSGNYRIFIIDEAHNLSVSAQNALLKTLEEPPKNVVFILISTNPNKFIPTLYSRCLRIFFRSLPKNTILQSLEGICQQENIFYDSSALALVSDFYSGSLRDALTFIQPFISAGLQVDLKSVSNSLGVPNSWDIWSSLQNLNSSQRGLIKSFRSLSESFYIEDIFEAITLFFRDVLYVDNNNLVDLVSFLDKDLIPEVQDFGFSLDFVNLVLNYIRDIPFSRLSSLQKKISLEVFLLFCFDKFNTSESIDTSGTSDLIDIENFLSNFSLSTKLQLRTIIKRIYKDGSLVTTDKSRISRYLGDLSRFLGVSLDSIKVIEE